jgi:hypothetical protein
LGNLATADKDTSVKHSDKADALFMQGYNCAQATAAAFAENFGLEPSFVLKSTAGFGAGIGGLRETCGAVGAMAYLAGLHIGPYAAGDVATKAGLYDLIKFCEYCLGRDASARQEISLRTIERCVQPRSIFIVKVVALIHGHQVNDRAFRQVHRLVEHKMPVLHGCSQCVCHEQRLP